MWRTPVGERFLLGDEADLVRHSVGVLADRIQAWEIDSDEGDFDSGIEVFDSLPGTQKLVLVEQVARYLLTETDESLPLTAATEAAVGAIFENLREQVEIELDVCRMGISDDEWAEDVSWRERILAAFVDSLEADEGFPEADLPDTECDDMERWDLLIDILADRILWDRDYEMAEMFLDDDPTTVATKKALMGIDQDYFVDLTPDPRDDELVGIRNSIRELVQSKPR